MKKYVLRYFFYDNWTVSLLVFCLIWRCLLFIGIFLVLQSWTRTLNRLSWLYWEGSEGVEPIRWVGLFRAICSLVWISNDRNQTNTTILIHCLFDMRYMGLCSDNCRDFQGQLLLVYTLKHLGIFKSDSLNEIRGTRWRGSFLRWNESIITIAIWNC